MNIKAAIANSELYLVVKTQLAEYWQNPLLNIGFIVSLAIATSTLLAILMLNHASKQQYQQADTRLGAAITYHIRAKQGQTVSKQDFAQLRKQGFSNINPVLSFRKKLTNGKWLTFKAMDLLALSISKPQSFDSINVLLPQPYGKNLGISGLQIMLSDGRLLPLRQITKADWGMTALLDIALAWQLFPELKDFSYLLVAEISAEGVLRLEQSLPEHLTLQKIDSLQQRQGFADALHLNLSALAVLGFIVSVFIAFQAANQAWQKRSELVSQLRLFGVSFTTIRLALLLEAVSLIVAASVIGTFIAVALVSVLLPLLGLTLNQLYQLSVSGHFDWHWRYGLWSLLISACAVLLSLFKQVKRINNPHLFFTAKPVNSRLPTTLIGIVTGLLLLLFLLWPETDWHQVMVKYGLFLIATVGILPLTMHVLIKLFLLSNSRRYFRLRLIMQDAANQIGRRFIPLAAFYLALSTSIAAALMVNSFETAFVNYLEQQLDEDLYIRFEQQQQPRLEQWLQRHPQVIEYLLYRHAVVNVGQDRVAVTTYQSPRQLATLVLKTEQKILNQADRYTAMTQGAGCLINEQLALKHNLTLGNEINLSQASSQMSCQVRGIYYDYGNPRYEISLPLQLAQQQLSGLTARGYGVYFSQYNTEIKQQLLSELALEQSQLIEPAEIKKMALDIFAQTFILSQGIAAVLLVIACFGLFLSAKSLELARKADLFILSSLGYSKIELFIHMLAQWLLLVAGCIVLSWPVAMVLAEVLVAKVFPVSFGWSMPLVLTASPFVSGSLIGLSCLFVALVIPLYKLNGRGHW
ncbi:FtsX-like permease family protein [Thalassotalea sp. ND16A]|uniref:FtsX-like permease family protein n=1 Tax=Thalassotalea sp. ND16A TaxID=1535422 RepID=UPI000519FF2C|nr:FtsX-like permease family protein [Thalassotalea sp. ND16A]KGJ95717.1 hypothetical protein ND16A_1252 [Thalassotalea sp. ND16A]